MWLEFRRVLFRSVITLGVDSTETIVVKADFPTMATGYEVEGSSESQKIKELTLKQIALQENLRNLATRNMPVGVLQDSVMSQVNAYKHMVKTTYIYPHPQSAVAYYALFQRVNGYSLFDPETNREDIKCFGAIATSWESKYPHALRTTNLRNITLRGMKNTRRPQAAGLPEELVSEVSLFDVVLPDLKGNIKKLTDLKGKVVILDFTVYQHKDSPARNIAFRKLYDQYASQGLEIYQVSLDGDEHFWKTSADNLPWICVRDADGQAALTYNARELPAYFLISKANELDRKSVV